jgi:hypothetical protein
MSCKTRKMVKNSKLEIKKMEVLVLGGGANQYKEADSIVVLSFGDVKSNSIVKADIEIKGVNDSTLTATCGCSSVKGSIKNRFTIQYNNTHIIEPFAKTFILSYREGNVNKQAQIKITGNIIK